MPALLIASQLIGDYLDSASERAMRHTRADGRPLHRALTDALDPTAPLQDYYTRHPWRDDGGYLSALVRACRTGCAALPGYPHVRGALLHGAAGCAVQSLHHDPDPVRRTAALKAWAASNEAPPARPVWFELTAATGAFTPHALLALAAEPSGEDTVSAIDSVYRGPVALAIAMLDSYADEAEDAASGEHSYIAHYPSPGAADRRLREIVNHALTAARELPAGHRHALLVACMVAMYLSKDAAAGSARRARSREIAHAGGTLTVCLAPVLRLWRATHSHRIQRVQLPTPGLARAALPAGSRAPSAVQTLLCWRRPLSYLERCRERYGTPFTYRQVGQPPLVFLADREHVKALFKAPAETLHPGEGARTIEPIVGPRSFMLLDEDEHLKGRRRILPALHSDAVNEHAQLVREHARHEIHSWPHDTPFATHPRLRAMTLKIALRTIFSTTASERLTVLHERLLATLDVTGSAVLSEPQLRHGPGLRVWRRFLRARADTDELIHTLIQERRTNTTQPHDTLGTLLAAHDDDGRPLSGERIRDELMSIILAGHETTSSQLAWAFQLLAHNPRAQARLIDEIDHDEHQEYLSATVHEILRHRPVFLFAIPRAVKQPFELGGITYHPPTRLLACIYLIHHDPHVYPDPHEFRPERFLEKPLVPANAWLPWGGGRKRCPGLHLALLEIQSVLRTVLSQMTVHPASRRMEHARWRSVIVTPHAGSRVILRARETPRRRMMLDRSTPAAEAPSCANQSDTQTNPLSEHF